MLLVGFGQGVDVIVVRVEDAARKQSRRARRRRHSTSDRGKQLRPLSLYAGLLDVDFGMRAERDNRTAHSVAYRRRREHHRVCGRALHVACQTVQFPKSRVCVNPECRATDTQADYRLADSHGRA